MNQLSNVCTNIIYILNKFVLLCVSYTCLSYLILSSTGPPGDISDVIIPPDTITACSFVVQWSRPSSDPMCGLVWYTVTVTTGGVLIINGSTTRTDYNVTGLNSSTTYNVNVNARNNAGSSSSTIMSIMTDNNGESVRGMYLDLFEEFLY